MLPFQPNCAGGYSTTLRRDGSAHCCHPDSEIRKLFWIEDGSRPCLCAIPRERLHLSTDGRPWSGGDSYLRLSSRPHRPAEMTLHRSYSSSGQRGPAGRSAPAREAPMREAAKEPCSKKACLIRPCASSSSISKNSTLYQMFAGRSLKYMNQAQLLYNGSGC